jgi:hypothetical protein
LAPILSFSGIHKVKLFIKLVYEMLKLNI